MVAKRRENRKLKQYFNGLSAICMSNWPMTIEYFLKYEYSFFRDAILGKKRIKLELQNWDITNKEELIAQLNWFIDEGRRAEVEPIYHDLSVLSKDARKAKVEALATGDENHSRYVVADTFIQTMPQTGIAGFDVAWCIYLCRLGKRIGLLSKEEANEFMIRAAKLAQDSFSGWEEYIVSFYIGSHFEAVIRNKERAYVQGLTTACGMLLDPKSIYNKIEWHTDLVEKTV